MKYNVELNEDELKEFLDYRKNKTDNEYMRKQVILKLEEIKQQLSKSDFVYSREYERATKIVENIFDSLNIK